MTMIVWIAVGGALGATGRYLVGGVVGGWFGTGLPWGTLMVNIIGSFALGALIEISALAWSPSEELRAFLVVGLLGGFTTFSAFSMDIVLLAERGRLDHAMLYGAASVVLALGGFVVGLRLIRLIVS